MNPIIIAGAVAIAGFVAVSSKGKDTAQADVVINGYGGAGGFDPGFDPGFTYEGGAVGGFTYEGTTAPFVADIPSAPFVAAIPTGPSPEEQDRAIYDAAIAGGTLSVPYSANWRDALDRAYLDEQDRLNQEKQAAFNREQDRLQNEKDRKAHAAAVAKSPVNVPYSSGWQAQLRMAEEAYNADKALNQLEQADRQAWQNAMDQYGVNVPYGPNWNETLTEAIREARDVEAWAAAVGKYGVAVSYSADWEERLTSKIDEQTRKAEADRLAELQRQQKERDDQAALAQAAEDLRRANAEKAYVAPVYVAPSYGMGIDDDYIPPVYVAPYVAPVYVDPFSGGMGDDDYGYYEAPVYVAPEPVYVDSFSGAMGDDDYGDYDDYQEPEPVYVAPEPVYSPPVVDSFSGGMGDDDYVGFDVAPWEPPSWADDG